MRLQSMSLSQDRLVLSMSEASGSIWALHDVDKYLLLLLVLSNERLGTVLPRWDVLRGSCEGFQLSRKSSAPEHMAQSGEWLNAGPLAGSDNVPNTAAVSPL
jgi:hypothetical protein